MSPDFYKLLSIDSLRKTADLTAEAVGENPIFFDEVMQIALSDNIPQNWRAVRVIDLVSSKYYDLFIPYVNEIAQKFTSFRNVGQKRGLSKILIKYTNKLSENNTVNLIETCFKYLMSGKEAIAVKIYCMQILYEMSKLNKDIIGELEAVILYKLDDETPAFKARARMILKKICKIH